MTAGLGIVTVAVGAAYLLLALVALTEIVGGSRTRGFSRFGVGLLVMGLSCGLHHVAHGIHSMTGGGGSVPVLVATIVGLPAAITIVGLRLEAMTGGRGDRFIVGTPLWISIAPIGFLILAGLLVDRSLEQAAATPDHVHQEVAATGLSWWVLPPNLFIALSYAIVGWFVLRTQVRRREEHGGWSLSGLAIGSVFPTCALMHLVVAFGSSHGTGVRWLDIAGVPVSVYFLWVVYGLYRQALVDWNRRPLAGDPGRPDRTSPWDHPGATVL